MIASSATTTHILWTWLPGLRKKSRRPKAFDHIDRRGKKSVTYEFATPFQLVADFFAKVEKVLKEESRS
jgi:hypothetical protein